MFWVLIWKNLDYLISVSMCPEQNSEHYGINVLLNYQTFWKNSRVVVDDMYWNQVLNTFSQNLHNFLRWYMTLSAQNPSLHEKMYTFLDNLYYFLNMYLTFYIMELLCILTSQKDATSQPNDVKIIFDLQSYLTAWLTIHWPYRIQIWQVPFHLSSILLKNGP